jgi:hypothetical protein
VRLGSLGTRRAGINPGTNKFPKLLLRTRCRIAALAGLPAPRYQIIVGEMFMEQFKIAAPISPAACYGLSAGRSGALSGFESLAGNGGECCFMAARLLQAATPPRRDKKVHSNEPRRVRRALWCSRAGLRPSRVLIVQVGATAFGHAEVRRDAPDLSWALHVEVAASQAVAAGGV